MVGTWVMFVGKVLIAMCTTGISGVIIYKTYPNINSPVMPMVVIFLLAYQIAALFMTMFETTIDTIFLCFLIDEKVKNKEKELRSIYMFFYFYHIEIDISIFFILFVCSIMVNLLQHLLLKNYLP
jgi:hypothetical protein